MTNFAIDSIESVAISMAYRPALPSACDRLLVSTHMHIFPKVQFFTDIRMDWETPILFLDDFT